MIPKARTWLFAVVLALSCGLLQAAYLEGDLPREPSPRPIVIPPPPPTPHNPLARMVRRLRVRPGHHYRGLTVFLLELPEIADDTSYLSTDEALRKGTLTVREVGPGAVPALVVENAGEVPILMLGGELLLGGKQNRVLRDDVLLPPRSGPIEVPVLCVERGRWSRGPSGFKSRRSVAPPLVRGSAQAGRSQDEIWAGVDHYQKRLKVESGTGDLQAVHDSPRLKEALADYREHFAERCWRPRAVGMVVARGGRIVGADIFCNAPLFRKHRSRLLESYALDCIAFRRGRPELRWRWPSPPDVGAAERFLRRTLRASYWWRATPGLGRLLALSSPGLSGSALVRRDNVLHACLFSEDEAVILRPSPLPPWRAPRPRGEQ